RGSESNKTAGKSTNPTVIPSLITVWLQVRVLPGPPMFSSIYRRPPLRLSHHRTSCASEYQHLCAQLRTQYPIDAISKEIFADGRKIGRRSKRGGADRN